MSPDKSDLDSPASEGGGSLSTTSTPSPSPPVSPDGRTRFVYQQWLRDPNGPILPRPPPSGVRPPNEIIWGHTLEDFFWVQRIPGVEVLTIWSRSMIKEYGENYDESEFSEPDALQVPRLRHPWPVLRVPNDGIHVPKDAYGVIDEGCYRHMYHGYVPQRRDEDASDLEQQELAKAKEIVKKLLEFSNDEGLFVPNDPHYPLRTPDGNVYAVLFASRARASFFQDDRNTLPTQTTSLPQLPPTKQVNGKLLHIRSDEYGIWVADDRTGKYALLDDDQDKKIGEEAQGESPPKSVDEFDILSSSEPVPYDSPFSIEDIPKLEESIPQYYFPDDLYVHDPHRQTTANENTYQKASCTSFDPAKPLLYRRVLPKLPRDSAAERDQPTSPRRVAHLYLAHQNRLGVGNHSLVHRAPLTLPAPLSAHSRSGRVTVAAKCAFPCREERELLVNEARIYDMFPEHFSQDWCGFNLVTPIKHPVPVGPVVPKFFGYYVPVRPDGSLYKETDGRAPSPILLLEECGEPVEPERFSPDERSECYSMMLRLHYDGFIQGSFYVRNIMVQPGPLTAPPEQRSKKCPSFRIIDFGRGEQWTTFLGDTSDERGREHKKREWQEMMSEEDRKAQRELQIPLWNY